MKNKKLIFVYNADGDIASSLIDAVHKIVKPSTYKCNLCMITYGAVSMKKEWRDFINNLGIIVEFLHKDEFEKNYGIMKGKFPAAYVSGDKLKLIITAEEINRCKDLDDLKELVSKKVIQ